MTMHINAVQRSREGDNAHKCTAHGSMAHQGSSGHREGRGVPARPPLNAAVKAF